MFCKALTHQSIDVYTDVVLGCGTSDVTDGTWLKMRKQRRSEARAVRPVVRRLQGWNQTGEVPPRRLLEQTVNLLFFDRSRTSLVPFRATLGAFDSVELFLV